MGLALFAWLRLDGLTALFLGNLCWFFLLDFIFRGFFLFLWLAGRLNLFLVLYLDGLFNFSLEVLLYFFFDFVHDSVWIDIFFDVFNA